MSQVRQLPLFANLSASETDLNPYSTLKETVTLFQRHLLRQGKTEHTLTAFTADLHLLGEWGGDDVRIGVYTTTLLNDFLQWMETGRGVSCSRKTYARRVTTLKVYFKWLHQLGAIPFDPANAILQRSGQAPLSEILSPDEVERAMRYAFALRRAQKPDPRPEMLFHLLITTGIKKGEMMNLTLDSIQRDPPVIVISHISPKDTYKERWIALDPDWLDVFDEYRAHYLVTDALFTCTARNLEYVLEDVGKGAGIEQKLSFEMLRWTCAVRDYRAGHDPEMIREKLGLSRISWAETFDKIKRLTAQQIDSEAGV